MKKIKREWKGNDLEAQPRTLLLEEKAGSFRRALSFCAEENRDSGKERDRPGVTKKTRGRCKCEPRYWDSWFRALISGGGGGVTWWGDCHLAGSQFSSFPSLPQNQHLPPHLTRQSTRVTRFTDRGSVCFWLRQSPNQGRGCDKGRKLGRREGGRWEGTGLMAMVLSSLRREQE